MIITGIIIKRTSKGPVFFKQIRSGKNNKLFKIYKFRSMKVDAPKNRPTNSLNNSEYYITSFGSFIRRYSVDELPQLLNVIKGDMSLVGPRPVITKGEDKLLLKERHKNGADTIKPGITGWAQVNGRDDLNYMHKATLDGEYISNICFLMDLLCLSRTINAVLLIKGYREGSKINASETVAKVESQAQ
jgi:O-antigen biosynthesis protein WbqP